jgi:hypothetical protein
MSSSRNLRLSAALVAALLASLTLAACGSSSNQSTVTIVKTVTVVRTQTAPADIPTDTATVTRPTSRTETTSTTGVVTPEPVGAPCTASVLTPSYLGSNGAAGTIELGFALTNSGSSTCHTYGWPGVELLSAEDAPLPTDAVRTTSDLLGSTPAALLNLRPGAEASFRIFESDSGAGGGSCEAATQLQIYAPDDTVTMKVALVGGVPACGKTTLSPMMPGTSAYSSQ